MASQITSLTTVYSTVYSGANQRIHQSSASLAFVRGNHRRPVKSPHKWPVRRKMFPFHDVIMRTKAMRWNLRARDVRISGSNGLTHWGRVTHICVSNQTIIGSDNGLSPARRQAIIWSNAVILLIRTLGTNFSEILSKIQTFPFKKLILKCRLRNDGKFVSASMC